jgi:hypothetical protein
MSLQNGKWLQDGSVEYVKLNIEDGDLSIAKVSGLQDALDDKVETSAVGVSIATLVAGKVPISQLPNAIMEYQGVWDASTNTPTLANGAGNSDEAIGNIYRVSVAGTVDFGAGNIEFSVGDYAILDSSKIWEKADMSDGVVSVNGQAGVVVLDADDIDDSSTTNKFASQAQLDKVDFISVTQAVDLDQLETDSHTHSNKAILDATTASFLVEDETKLDFITVTQAVDLDAMESAIANIDIPAALTEEFVLVAGDITNQYVTLTNSPIVASLIVYPDGGPIQRYGVDFSVTGTQLDFDGDLASLLEAGDILIVKYQY